jgi:hypothetical protein
MPAAEQSLRTTWCCSSAFPVGCPICRRSGICAGFADVCAKTAFCSQIRLRQTPSHFRDDILVIKRTITLPKRIGRWSITAASTVCGRRWKREETPSTTFWLRLPVLASRGPGNSTTHQSWLCARRTTVMYRDLFQSNPPRSRSRKALSESAFSIGPTPADEKVGSIRGQV